MPNKLALMLKWQKQQKLALHKHTFDIPGIHSSVTSLRPLYPLKGMIFYILQKELNWWGCCPVKRGKSCQKGRNINEQRTGMGRALSKVHEDELSNRELLLGVLVGWGSAGQTAPSSSIPPRNHAECLPTLPLLPQVKARMLPTRDADPKEGRSHHHTLKLLGKLLLLEVAEASVIMMVSTVQQPAPARSTVPYACLTLLLKHILCNPPNNKL